MVNSVNVDQKKKSKNVAFIDEEAPYSDNPTPKHPDWNITEKGGKKKKKRAT